MLSIQLTNNADRLQVLAIGAHPDDIEIGAAALITKAASNGAEAHFLILTDEQAMSPRRRLEAVHAAEVLGVPSSRVVFAGFVDGKLRADADTVRRVREIIAARDLRPDIVVTHTLADSHNDHVESNRIAHAAFRGCVFLQFSIHVSSEPSRFAPRVFVEVAGERVQKKDRALSLHRSQVATISRHNLAEYERQIGSLARLDRAEGFEIDFQSHAFGVLEKTISLSDSPFHRFWVPVVGDGDVSLLYGGFDGPNVSARWSAMHENAGRDRLRQAFIDQWAPSYPLREQFANTPKAAMLAQEAGVVLVGNPVTNRVMRQLYKASPENVWTIDHGAGQHESPRLYNRINGKQYHPKLTSDGVERDFGMIAHVENPSRTNMRVICVAGSTGFGTRVGLEFLADPGQRPDLAHILYTEHSAEIAFTVDTMTAEMEIIDIQRRGGPDV
jgi:LmbE family N-acetylglucosaminyl deacetylase